LNLHILATTGCLINSELPVPKSAIEKLCPHF